MIALTGLFSQQLGAASLSPSALAPTQPKGYRSDRILLKLKPGVSADQLDHFHSTRGSRVRHSWMDSTSLQSIEIPQDQTVESHLAAYRASGWVEVAEPDYWMHTAALPNDPYVQNGDQWHLNNLGLSGGLMGADIHAPEAWETLRSASNTVVAIIDTGIFTSHPDLASALWTNPGEIPDNGIDDDGNGIVDDVHGLNAAANSGDIQDVVGHGTFICGLIGAVGNNGIGVSGVAWQVQLMMCRYVDNQGNGSLSDVLQCFDYARIQGAKVINASFVSTNYSLILQSAINNCRNAGIVVVAGVGNDGANIDASPTYPASFNLDNVLAVTATDRSDTLASFSNYGATNVDIAVPGKAIASTQASAVALYAVGDGTSFSTAIMSGAMALITARFPGLSPAQRIQRALTTVDALPSLAGKCVSGGRLNLARALGPPVVVSFSYSPTSTASSLTLQFTNNAFGAVTDWAWDFGDGQMSSLANPLHTFESRGRYSVLLTARDLTGHVGSTHREVIALENYRMSAGSSVWIDPSGMTAHSLSQNGVSAAIPLPFTFFFYGEPWTAVYMGANGLMGFAASGLETSANVDLPASSAPNALLCPLWDALAPSTSTRFYTGVVGTAPNRRFVASWVDVQTTGARPAPLTFQCILEETSQRILFQYLDVAATSKSSSASGKSASIGIQEATGTLAARYAYNGSDIVTNGMAILFTPAMPFSPLAITPAAGLTFNGPTGGPFAPASPSLGLTNTGLIPLTWNATVAKPWMTLSSNSGTLPPGQGMEVTIALTPAATALTPGVYSGIVRFSTTEGQDNAWGMTAQLTVESRPRAWIEMLPEHATPTISVLGDPFARYQIQMSLDLAHWTTLGQGIAGADGKLLINDPSAAGEPGRFYRAVLLP